MNITEKIKKCLELSKSSNKHEADLALSKAYELLQKHNLTLADLETSTTTLFKTTMSLNTKTISKFQAHIGYLVAEHCGCYLYIQKFKSKQQVLMLIGLKDNVESSVELIKYIFSAYKSQYSTYLKLHSDRSQIDELRDSYFHGFVEGINSMWNSQYPALIKPTLPSTYMDHYSGKCQFAFNSNPCDDFINGYNTGIFIIQNQNKVIGL